MTIRVLIADDHLFYREGVRTLLNTAEGIEIVGEASNGHEVVARAAELQPHIILMDLKMPGPNGIDATRQIIQKQPNVGILVVTMFDDDESVFAVMRAGARGYILKDADQEELVRAVTAVFRGEAIFSPTIAQRMMNYFSNVSREGRSKADTAFPELTERELDILELIAQGHGNPAIANKLSLSVKTVQNYVSNILNKLQVVDRSEAIVRAREKGLGVDKK
ncbi:MAG TPA: response regulator transcription factor [Anaerolineales bacterium]|nr:response regulator transcription factor [Anaerolineales bacterium]